jgi:hypothetical protein
MKSETAIEENPSLLSSTSLSEGFKSLYNQINGWHTEKYTGGLILNKTTNSFILLEGNNPKPNGKETKYNYSIIPKGLYRVGEEGIPNTEGGKSPLILSIPIGFKRNIKGETNKAKWMSETATFRQSDLACIRRFFRPFPENTGNGYYVNLARNTTNPRKPIFEQNNNAVSLANFHFLLQRSEYKKLNPLEPPKTLEQQEMWRLLTQDLMDTHGLTEELVESKSLQRLTLDALSIQAAGKFMLMMNLIVAHAHLSTNPKAKEVAEQVVRDINEALLKNDSSYKLDVNSYFNKIFVNNINESIWNDAQVAMFQWNPKLKDTKYAYNRDPLRTHPDAFAKNLSYYIKEKKQVKIPPNDAQHWEGIQLNDDNHRWGLPQQCIH